MNPQSTNPQLTQASFDADLDRALATAADGILPSSGFADSVMTAVYREASAPAPIPFPWKRALPGLAAALAALVLLLATIPTVLHSLTASARSAPTSLNGQLDWPTLAAPLAHHANDIVWLLASLAISAACLLLCRRLVSPR